ncbi:MAG: transcriptional regulator [Anaerolineaceae bacterium]|nr:MAG: transcriptional regulator [Anaerolineaceae bacterium]
MIRVTPELSADDLSALLDDRRNERLDWFRDTTGGSHIGDTLAAMANAQGGHLLIGVVGAETPQALGVDDPQATIEALLNAALALTPPLITPLPTPADIAGKTIIAVEVPAGMPYIYLSDGRYLTRTGAENIVLKPTELHRLILQRGEISFETEIAPRATLDDLDWDKVNDYARLLRIAENDAENLLYKRGCLAKQGDEFRPTNAGILLFGKDPAPHIRGTEITAVRFAGEKMGDTFSRQDINGTLPDQIRRAETFLLDHMRKGVALKGTMARSEQPEYPMEAAREVVVNAVAHRDYSIQGDGIRLFLFKDRMEVNSPGRLPGPVTLANIKDERFSRNPAIVQVLSDMGFIERLGYGVDRMIDLMAENDLREPEFSETDSGFRVKLYNASFDALADDAADDQPEEEPITLDEYAHVLLNPRQEAALIYLKRRGNTRITNSQLQGMFPDVHAETIRRDLADLVTKDILHKLGQKRGSFYVLKASAPADDDTDSAAES